MGKDAQSIREGMARGNALELALGACAVGLIVGACMPVSRLERERAATLGDRLAESAVAKADATIVRTKSAIGGALANARRPKADDYAGQDGFDEAAAQTSTPPTGTASAVENTEPAVRYGAAV